MQLASFVLSIQSVEVGEHGKPNQIIPTYTEYVVVLVVAKPPTFSPNKYNKSNVDFAGGGGGGARSPILTQIWVRDFSYSDAREKVKKAWTPLVPPSMASPAAY